MKHKIKTAILVIVVVLLSTACMKDYLDIKRDKSQVLPVTLDDYRSIFENQNMNTGNPILAEIGADDYYILEPQWQALSDPIHKNAYIWADEVFQGASNTDWNRAYERILYANFVYEGVSDIEETPTNKALRDEVIGAAYFFRGINFFLLAQLFCKQYDLATSNVDLGLPLRTTSNINVQYQRATLEDTYRQIISDLEKAAILLPHEMSLNTRPYRAAALGILANVHLQIGDYQSAFNFADTAFTMSPTILDYNEVNRNANFPFPLYGRDNKEIIFYTSMPSAAILNNARINIDSLLYDSYSENDLRKQAFFFVNGGRNVFKGSYSGLTLMFSGLTNPELLLIRAECSARLGNMEDSIEDLNRLLSNRFSQEHFEPIINNITQNDLLLLILSERRKELIFRGRRWHDLKRFDKEQSLAKPLKRVLDETEYILPINSPKWVWPIPPDVIERGGIEQNER